VAVSEQEQGLQVQVTHGQEGLATGVSETGVASELVSVTVTGVPFETVLAAQEQGSHLQGEQVHPAGEATLPLVWGFPLTSGRAAWSCLVFEILLPMLKVEVKSQKSSKVVLKVQVRSIVDCL